MQGARCAGGVRRKSNMSPEPDPVARKIYAQAEDTVNRHAEVEILRYAA